MVTKGEVLEILTEENKLSVRIPFFETVNGSKIVLKCTVCYNPGNLNAYKPNDVVWVAFEDGSASYPVVIGKLYTGIDEEASNFSLASDLKVENSATLPTNTSIGGVNLSKIINNIKENVLQQDQIDQLFDKVKYQPSFPKQIIQTTKEVDLNKMQEIYGTDTEWKYKDSSDIRTWTRTK